MLRQGDPRNIALLLHWDGFQSSRTTQKDCGVVEIKILNGGKGSIIGVLPVLFIPFSCKKIIRKSNTVFSAFLRPLMDELEDIYMNGVDVVYNYALENIFDAIHDQKKECKLRGMLMMVSGDHPAQCKIGLFKDGGKEGCRRDKVKAELDTSNPSFKGRYIYNENRLQARYAPPKRSTKEMVNAILEAKRASTQAQRQLKLAEAGLSGVSILWRFHDLYGFDLSLDLVYDTMHILSLNLFSKYISLLMRGLTNEVKKKVDTCTKAVFKLAPPSIRYGRWPHNPSKYCESYKAEENQKFIQWCLPYILSTIEEISKPLNDVGILLIDIAHTFYNYSRDNGWSKESMDVVRTLFLSWRVRMEELYGATSSPLEHVAGNGELLDDIFRHGAHDVFWCYAFERMVSTYMGVKTNRQSNEITYAHFYKRTLFTFVTSLLQKERDGLLPHQRQLMYIHKCLVLPDGLLLVDKESLLCDNAHKHGVLELSSMKKATEIWNGLMMHPKENPCCINIREKGIALTRKKRVTRYLSREEQRYFEQLWHAEEGHFKSLLVTSYAKILYKGEFFRAGDHVVVKVDDAVQNVTNVGHWKAKIKTLFCVQYNGECKIFFGAEYYRQCIQSVDGHEELMIHPVMGMSMLQQHPLPYTWDCVRPISSLLHKFMALPIRNKLIAYEIKDISQRQRLLKVGEVGCIPPWLEVNDIVFAHKETGVTGGEILYAVIRELDTIRRQCKIAWLIRDQVDQSKWRVDYEDSTWRDWDTCIMLASNFKVVTRRRIMLPNGVTCNYPQAWICSNL